MRAEDILGFLQRIGLGENESKVYIALSMKGTLKAGEISRQSGVPQSKVYWVLEELIGKQLVEVSDAKPREYKAVKPDLALHRLLEEKERSLSDFRSGIKEVSGYLRPMREGESMSGIWTTRGRNWVEFFNKTTEMVDRSRKYIYGITRDFSRSAKLSETLEAAIRKGVKIRVIGMEEITEGNYFKAKWYMDKGAELRIMEASVHPRIVVVDGKEVLLRLDHEHNKKDGFPFSSVWSQDPSLVKVFDTYVKNLWDNSRQVNLKDIEKVMSS